MHTTTSYYAVILCQGVGFSLKKRSSLLIDNDGPLKANSTVFRLKHASDTFWGWILPFSVSGIMGQFGSIIRQFEFVEVFSYLLKKKIDSLY